MPDSLDINPVRNLGLLVNDVARLMRRRFEEVARERGLGLTRAQSAVLIHLARQEGINQVTLAQLMELEPITLVRLLDRLQVAGLVERRPDPDDRRARHLYLTEPATRCLGRILDLSEEVRERAMDGLRPGEREAFIRALGVMKMNLLNQVSDQRCGLDVAAVPEQERVNG